MAKQQGDFFRSADPFPHVVIDDFFEPETYQFALEQFPATESEIWKSPTNLHTFNKKVIRGGVEGVSTCRRREETVLGVELCLLSAIPHRVKWYR
jgi:hypothetical protein